MDPFLHLADLDRAVPCTISGTPCRVVPQRNSAGSNTYHPRLFYVEYETDSGLFYQIDSSRLVAVLGDGGTGRSFNAKEVAYILGTLSSKLKQPEFLKSISL